MTTNSRKRRVKAWRVILALVALLGLVLGACGPAATPEPPTAALAPPTNTPIPTDTPLPPTETPVPSQTPIPSLTPYAGEPRIVFSSNRADPNKLDLYLIDPASPSNIAPLNTGFDLAIFPRWSPDGNQIVFTVGEPWAIHTVYADGTHLSPVTDFSSANADWSPDGSRLVFQSDHQNEPKDTPDIYLMDANGENLLEILDAPEVHDYAARWSPDGGRILFVSRRTGKGELFVMNPDGTDVVQLTETVDPIGLGVWSPDGARIAFVSGRFNQTDLFVMNADGSNVRQLTSDTFTDDGPAWSPDGERIVFFSNRGGSWDLWLVNADGANLSQLTNDEFYDAYPDWSR